MSPIIPPDNIGLLIGDVSRMIRTVYDRRVEHLGITRAQWRAMVRLSRLESCTQTQLAAELEIEKPTLGKLIERLEAKGWVERHADARDGRTKRLYLTPKAKPVLDEMYEMVDEMQARVFAGLTPEDEERLHDMMMQVKGNLSAMLDETQKVEA